MSREVDEEMARLALGLAFRTDVKGDFDPDGAILKAIVEEIAPGNSQLERVQEMLEFSGDAARLLCFAEKPTDLELQCTIFAALYTWTRREPGREKKGG